MTCSLIPVEELSADLARLDRVGRSRLLGNRMGASLMVVSSSVNMVVMNRVAWKIHGLQNRWVGSFGRGGTSQRRFFWSDLVWSNLV